MLRLPSRLNFVGEHGECPDSQQTLVKKSLIEHILALPQRYYHLVKCIYCYCTLATVQYIRHSTTTLGPGPHFEIVESLAARAAGSHLGKNETWNKGFCRNARHPGRSQDRKRVASGSYQW